MHAASLRTPTGTSGNWLLQPASYFHASVSGGTTDENYAALLMGEVSGNWVDGGPRPVGSRQLAEGGEQTDISVELPKVLTGDKEIVISVFG